MSKITSSTVTISSKYMLKANKPQNELTKIQRIRDIRSSERNLYQQVTDIQSAYKWNLSDI